LLAFPNQVRPVFAGPIHALVRGQSEVVTYDYL
jgi:hypothetical protein